MKTTTPRTMQVLTRDADGTPSALALTTGKPETKSFCRTIYTIRCTPVADGTHYHLTKATEGSDAECGAYDVLIGPEGNECDCKGFARHSHCKHVDACLALSAREAQRPRFVTCEWCGGSGLFARSDYRCRPCNGTGQEAA